MCGFLAVRFSCRSDFVRFGFRAVRFSSVRFSSVFGGSVRFSCIPEFVRVRAERAQGKAGRSESKGAVSMCQQGVCWVCQQCGLKSASTFIWIHTCSAHSRVSPDICQMDSWVICATSKNLRGQHREQKRVVCASAGGGEESENGVKELSKGAEEVVQV